MMASGGGGDAKGPDPLVERPQGNQGFHRPAPPAPANRRTPSLPASQRQAAHPIGLPHRRPHSRAIASSTPKRPKPPRTPQTQTQKQQRWRSARPPPAPAAHKQVVRSLDQSIGRRPMTLALAARDRAARGGGRRALSPPVPSFIASAHTHAPRAPPRIPQMRRPHPLPPTAARPTTPKHRTPRRRGAVPAEGESERAACFGWRPRARARAAAPTRLARAPSARRRPQNDRSSPLASRLAHPLSTLSAPLFAE